MATGSSLAVWRPIPGKNYGTRFGLRIRAIALHTMCGTLSGTDSWFRQWNVRSCSHYGVGRIGTIYQWIDETVGSWANANRTWDCQTITIETEGGLKGVPCTEACIEATARLCADISRRYGLGRLWHDGLNGNVVLHREIPGTTHLDCPDLAPNGLPYQRVISLANQILENGDDEVVSDNDIKRIIDGVTDSIIHYAWTNGDGVNTAVGGNLYNALMTSASEAAKAYDVAGDGTTGRGYERLAWVDKRTRDLWNGGVMAVLRKPNGACYLLTAGGLFGIPDPAGLSAIQGVYKAINNRDLPFIQFTADNENQIESIARIYAFRTDPTDTDKPYNEGGNTND